MRSYVDCPHYSPNFDRLSSVARFHVESMGNGGNIGEKRGNEPDGALFAPFERMHKLCSRLHFGPICSRLHKYAFDCILLGVNYLTLSWTVKRSFGVNEKDFFHHYVFLRMVRSFWIFPFGAARCAIAN